MASNYRTTGVHQLNKWLWSRLQTLQYKGAYAFEKFAPHGAIPLVPIIPSQQLPEFTEIAGGAPFIVYNYTDLDTGSTWYIQEQTNAYVIYDNDEERLRTIHNYMIDLLRRMDWTAQEVNSFLMAGIEPGTQADQFDFKSVYVTLSNGPEPFEQQGGRQGALVVCRTMFTHDLDDTGMRI
jgi:hypothetical protein